MAFFNSIRNNSCKNTPLSGLNMTATASQVSSSLAIASALMCVQNTTCIKSELEMARDTVSNDTDHLGENLLTLFNNKTIMCTECTRQQSIAIQSIPISNLDPDFSGNMQYAVDRLNKQCSMDGVVASNLTATTALLQNHVFDPFRKVALFSLCIFLITLVAII